MKKVSIIVPCYNEENNVEPMAEKLTEIMEKKLKYDYEIVFRNNASTDKTMEKLRLMAEKNKKIKVISNARNYGVSPIKDTFIGRVTGDVIICIACDFQEPPELIPEFLYWWERGYEVVAGQKTASKEGKIKYGLRQIFYKLIGAFSENPQVKNMSGITLMSRRIAELWWGNNRDEYFRYFVTDLGVDIKLIPYVQEKRRSGKSSYNIWKSLSFALDSMIMTSVAPLRIATVLGVICSVMSFLIGLIYLILKLIWWYDFAAGTAPILIGLFFIGSIQLLFIGIVGEYVGVILRKTTVQNPPIVNELINIDENDPYYFKRVNDDCSI